MALTLDTGRHALACATCGAPLKDLKALPVKKPERPAISHPPVLRQFANQARTAGKMAEKPRKKAKKGKRRKSLFTRLAEEAFDLVEEIFD